MALFESDIHNKNLVLDKTNQNKEKQKAQVHEKWAQYSSLHI